MRLTQGLVCASAFWTGVAAAGSPVVAESLCPGADGEVVVNFGQWSKVEPLERDLNATNEIQSFSRANARYMRLMFQALDLGDSQWSLKLVDDRRRLVEAVGPAGFSDRDGGLRHFMTNRHLTETLTAVIDHYGVGATPSFAISGLVVMHQTEAPNVYYSRQDPSKPPRWQDPYTATSEHARFGDNVALVMVGQGLDAAPAFCSGIALPPDLLLTNWHCGIKRNTAGNILEGATWGDDVCSQTYLDLSWDSDSVSREFVCVDVVHREPALDYALLKIAPKNGFDRLGSVAVALAETGTDGVLIFHHPAAHQKVMSTGCRVTDARHDGWQVLGAEGPAGSRFRHDCDTSPGSSGAPVFNYDGHLIGLHHAMFEINPATGQCDYRNKAIRIEAILEDLASQAVEGNPTIRSALDRLLGSVGTRADDASG